MEYFDYAGTSPLNMKIFKEIYETNDFMIYLEILLLFIILELELKILNSAREMVSNVLKCAPEEIIFTSGGSESDNMALFGIMYSRDKKYEGKMSLL